MWTPDIRTLFLIFFLVNSFLTLMLFAFWKTQKTYDGFAIWTVSLLLQSFAYLLYMLRGSVPDLLSIPVANLLNILSIMMHIDGIRRFFWSKPMPVRYYSLLIPIFVTYTYFTFIADSTLIRAFISTLFISPTLIIAGLLPLQARERENKIIRYLFAAALTIPSFVLIARLIAWMSIPGQYTLFSTDAFNTAFFVVAIIADILATGFFLMLNMVRSQNELRQTNKKLTLLSGITRHDIRNQLQALMGFLELSRQSLGDPTRLSELITKEERIAGTIEHQISFTRDYEIMGVAAPAWQNVGLIVRLVLVALPVKDVRVDADRSDLEIYADRLLSKVFYNLIDNALRYGGNTLTRICISSLETPDGLTVVCEDDGAGIAQKNRKRLFERGYGKHTGLGLFLSREILSITGITIRENGVSGKGARFEIYVPKGKYRFGKG